MWMNLTGPLRNATSMKSCNALLDKAPELHTAYLLHMAPLNTTSESQIRSRLLGKHLPPTQAWLNAFVAAQNPNVPVAALKQTALFRLLTSDLTLAVDKMAISAFPANVLEPSIKERTLTGSIPVQVLDVEDVGCSRWSQVEAIEAAERGETTKGREIIRVVPGESSSTDAQNESSEGPCRLLVQDVNGTKLYAFELNSIPGIGLKMSIGAKLILEKVTISRTVLMLEPCNTTFAGGRMDSLHKAWKADQKARLKTAFVDIGETS